MDNAIAQGFRLSPQQRRIWRLLTREPGSVLRSRCALRLEGELDRSALDRALRSLAGRHEILRTDFPVLPGMTLPLQVIRPAGPGEALPATLATPNPGEHELRLDLPALCADPASLAALGREIARAYAAARGERAEEDGDAPLQYADLAEWQNELLESEETAEGVERWREQWREQGLSALLAERLPGEEEAPSPGPFEPAELAVPLAPGTAAGIARLALEWGCPEAALLLAAWQALLPRSAGVPDALVGVLFDGRRHADLSGAIGPLARYLPAAVRKPGDEPARRAAERARDTLEDLARRQHLFDWDLVAGQPESGGEPFFPAAFDPGLPPWEHTAAGLRFRLERCEGTIDRFVVELARREDGLGLRYDPRRLRREGAERLAERLAALLASLVERPEATLEELDLLGERERELLAGFARGPESPVEADCLHRRFEAQAERTPDRPAVLSGETALTYAELNARANRLAWHLLGLGAGPEARVAVCLERSADSAAAVLGILKAGAAWVPLDPTQPAERLAFVLADADASLVVTEEKLAASLPAARLLRLDADAAALAAEPATNPGAGALPDSLAYVIYTSGSTGRPKGVLIAHRSPLHLLAGLEAAVYSRHRPGPRRASLNAPLFFDASVQQLVLLLAGHTLVVVPEAVRTDGAALLSFLAENEVDVLDCTPTQLRLLVAAGLTERPGGPEIVLCAGEAVDAALWSELRRSRWTTFYDIYGPTEATVDATAHRIGEGEASAAPTIGRPLAGYEVHLLDPRLRPVPLSAPGEIAIGGPGLARGYAGRPDLTAERFVPHPLAHGPGERLYRTGDLGRWRPDGELEFLGRIDHQVKVRGYRIEPGEIELALARHPWVRETVVVAHREAPDRATLVAYVRPTPEAPSGLAGAHGELRAFLGQSLPSWMVPAAFVALEAFPLTPSGKVDRRELAGRPPAPASGRGARAEPQTPRERALAEIWSQVLGVDSIGADESFFSLGGDSIRSLQVQALARQWGLDFTVQELFQHQTLRALAAAVREAGEETGEAPRSEPFRLLLEEDRRKIPGGPAGEIEDAYPLTLLQTGMLFHHEMSPESGVYQDIVTFRVRARFDATALDAVAQEVARRHPVLRTSFDLGRYTLPLQLVHRSVRVPVFREDLSGLPPERQEQEIAAFLEREKASPLDWRQPPLIRIHLHGLGEDRFQFTLTEHHAILDGWSVASLLTELFHLYAAALGEEEARPEPPPPAVFRELVALERQALATDASRSYWLDLLADAPRTRLPRWPPAPGDAGPVTPEIFELALSEETGRGLRELARNASVPIKSVLLAAHLRVLAALSGETDVLTGLSSDGRPEMEGADRALGLYVGMLPLRARLAGGTWTDLAHEAFAAERGLLPHRRFPLAAVQHLLGGGVPLFETFFNFTHFHIYQGVERVGGIAIEGGSRFELMDLPLAANFWVDPFSQRLGLGLNVHSNVIAEEQARAILDLYERTLSAMARDPEERYDTFSPLSPDERRRILTAAGRGPALPDPGRPFHRLFEERAALAPERIAVEGEGQRLTYGELDRMAGEIADRLRGMGAGPEDRVAVALERSPRLVAALLGVMKAGGAYVPLDPEYPRERLAWVLADSAPAVLLTERRTAGALPPAPAAVLSLDDPPEESGGPAPASHRPQTPGEHPAYVLYTSGSTGRPKGVSVPHRALANFLESMRREPGLGPDDVLVAVTSLSFDIAGLELYLPLLAGARVVIAGREEAADGRRLSALLASSRATVLQATPATWRLLLEAGWQGGPGFRAFIGGEAVPPGLAAELRRRAGEVWNLYGPTETTIWSTAADLTRVDSVTLGRPIAQTQVYVADPFGQPALPGVPGELLIGGSGLARGYLNRPDLTAERFVPDPFGGEPGARLYRTGDLGRLLPRGDFECLGRLDFQVKLRGFRIELGEIEAALEALPGVREAVAVAFGEGESRRLAAYYAPGPEGAPLAAAELREALRERLPDPMVPALFVALEALPRTPNGKIDRRRLPPPDLAQASPVSGPGEAPRNETERILAGLWAEALEVERVGIHDRFLELGGHSLLAMRLVARIRETFEVELPLRELYEAGTVARLAVKVVAAQAGQADHGALELVLNELEGMTEAEIEALLAAQAEETGGRP